MTMCHKINTERDSESSTRQNLFWNVFWQIWSIFPTCKVIYKWYLSQKHIPKKVLSGTWLRIALSVNPMTPSHNNKESINININIKYHQCAHTHISQVSTTGEWASQGVANGRQWSELGVIQIQLLWACQAIFRQIAQLFFKAGFASRPRCRQHRWT